MSEDLVSPSEQFDEIISIIDETPFISDLQNCFYKRTLKKRKECILDYSMSMLNKK